MKTDAASNEGSGFSPKMALCLAAITMVGIDGVFKEEELDKLRELIQVDETAFLKAFNFYNEHTLDVCLKVVSSKLNNEQKKAAYILLYDLARVDYNFVESEQQLMNRYAAAFGLDSEFVASLNTFLDHKFDLTLFK